MEGSFATLEASVERDNSFDIAACTLLGYVDSVVTYMPHLDKKPRTEIFHNRIHQMDLFSSV